MQLDKLKQVAIDKIIKCLKEDETNMAAAVAKQLLKVDPENAQGLQLYSATLFGMNKFSEGIEVANKAILLDPSNAENHNNIALCYSHSGDFEKAIFHIEKAISLKDDINFLNNKGLILGEEKADEAINCFELALKKDSQNSRAWLNLANTHGQTNQIDDAIKCFKECLEIEPENLVAHMNLGYAYHLNEDWEKAWPQYEWRLPYWRKWYPDRFKRLVPDKAWNGKDSLVGKKIVLYCEEGSGDMIHFIRFAPKLRELGGEVIIETSKDLLPLLEDFGTVVTRENEIDLGEDFRTVVTKEDDYDYHCSALSLPYFLNLIYPHQFMKQPYIFPKGAFPCDFEGYKDFFKIGIAWAGNPGHANDTKRSAHLKNFEEISKLPGVKLFNFQKELGKRVYLLGGKKEIDLAEGYEGKKIVDLSGYMNNYRDTVEMLDHMDLVITVDTCVLHLAGAMGKETWGLIPCSPDWRWGLNRNDSNWYSSVTLFRQEKLGDWPGVFSRVCQCLIGKGLSASKEN